MCRADAGNYGSGIGFLDKVVSCSAVYGLPLIMLSCCGILYKTIPGAWWYEEFFYLRIL